MKTITVLTALTVIFFSCSRDNGELSTNTDAEISFDFKGTHYNFKGNAIATAGTGTYAEKRFDGGGLGFYYTFWGMTNSANDILILIPTDSLKTITYHHVHQDGDALTLNGKPYSVLTNDDYLDITITGYNNQIVNGSFGGKISTIINMSPFTTQQETITNGQIKNLKMHYNY